jgi:hypothetical protein
MMDDVINAVHAVIDKQIRCDEISMQLAKARQELVIAKHNLTTIAYQKGDTGWGWVLPEEFYIEKGDHSYYVQIDVDGEHGHQVRQIDEIK